MDKGVILKCGKIRGMERFRDINQELILGMLNLGTLKYPSGEVMLLDRQIEN